MMSNNKNLFLWGGVLLIGIGLTFYGYFYKNSSDSSLMNGDMMPTENLNPTPIDSPEVSPGSSLAPQPFIGPRGAKKPASCRIEGEINFSSMDSFSSMGSKITWQNVDSQGRLILWHISPQDNIAIGPNLFANLTIPDGQYENLTVRLPEKSLYKQYILTASITYGQVIDGDVKVRETNCVGQVKVKLNF